MDPYEDANKESAQMGISYYAYIANDDNSGNNIGGDRTDALNAINKFANDPKTSSVFPNISKNDFVMDLKNIVTNPGSIDQGNLGTCGAAVLSKIFAEGSPLDYVNAALSLYQTGSATLNSMTIPPPNF